MFYLGAMALQTLEDAKGIKELEEEAWVVFELGRAMAGGLIWKIMLYNSASPGLDGTRARFRPLFP